MYLTTDMETTLVESVSCECVDPETGNVLGVSILPPDFQFLAVRYQSAIVATVISKHCHTFKSKGYELGVHGGF